MRNARRQTKRWTPQQDGFLRIFYRSYETPWVALILDRSCAQITARASKLRLKKGSRRLWKGRRGPHDAFPRFLRGEVPGATFRRGLQVCIRTNEGVLHVQRACPFRRVFSEPDYPSPPKSEYRCSLVGIPCSPWEPGTPDAEYPNHPPLKCPLDQRQIVVTLEDLQ